MATVGAVQGGCESMMTSSMETVSALLVLCERNPTAADGFPSQRTSNAGFDIFFGIILNKRLNKQTSQWWFETPRCSLWRQCNGANFLRRCTSLPEAIPEERHKGNIDRTVICFVHNLCDVEEFCEHSRHNVFVLWIFYDIHSGKLWWEYMDISSILWYKPHQAKT